MIKEIVDFIKNNKWYVLLVLALLGLYFSQFHGGLSSDSEKWDHFGSYIGGIFSAVTLLSVLHGMQLERKRFNEQKAEFEAEKKENEERRRKEEFERTFFMMLEQHNETLRFLENKENGTQNIREYFNSQTIQKRSIVDNIYYYMAQNTSSFKEIRFSMKDDVNYADVNAYFIVLYRILKFIYKNKEFNINKEYSSLLRSFLSRKILLILAYHLCQRGKDYEEFKLYIREFSFLEHIDLMELEKQFINICVFNYLNERQVLDDIDYVFDNIVDKSSQELITYIIASGNYDNKSLDFFRNLILRKKDGIMNNTLLSDIHLNGIQDHLFLHILRDLDKDSFKGNHSVISSYYVYYDLIG